MSNPLTVQTLVEQITTGLLKAGRKSASGETLILDAWHVRRIVKAALAVRPVVNLSEPSEKEVDTRMDTLGDSNDSRTAPANETMRRLHELFRKCRVELCKQPVISVPDAPSVLGMRRDAVSGHLAILEGNVTRLVEAAKSQ